MSIRVAINGFGRVGRSAFRSAYETGADVWWVAVNDVADVATLAHLLKHDSVYGPFPGRIQSTKTHSSSTAGEFPSSPRATPPGYPGASSART